MSSSGWFIPQLASVAQTVPGQARAWNPELHLGLLCG